MTFNFNVGGLTPQDALPGGGGGSTTVVEGLCAKNTAGLCVWLDAEINSRYRCSRGSGRHCRRD